jgi:26 proteasome complex subunit DSS1
MSTQQNSNANKKVEENKDKTTTTTTTTGKDDTSTKDKKLDITSLEEDDEFEEFPVEEWSQEDLDTEDKRLWEEHWDDDVVETPLIEQLKQELNKHGLLKTTTTAK